MKKLRFAALSMAALLAFGGLSIGVNAKQPQPKAKAKAKGKLAPPRVPEGVEATRNIDYVGDGNVRHQLDLYVPKGEGPWPVVVWVHGGAWRVGSKEACRALFLASRGFAVASINYRFVETDAFPAQIEDCRAAVRWVRANAKKYHLDADHIGAWGGSAGGHLVALLGTASDETGWDVVGGNTNVSAKVQAVCDYFGHTDFESLLAGDRPFPASGPISKLMGGDPRQKRDVVRKASAVTFVSKDDPPFLIVHGDHDQTVPLQQSQSLAAKLKDAGVDVTLIVVKNGQHGDFGPDAEPRTQEISETVAAFFAKHLKGAKPAAAEGDK